jgi:hypothetical protein
MSLAVALGQAEEIRALLKAEVERARSQRKLIRTLDAAGMLSYAQARGAANTRLAALEAALAESLRAAAQGRPTLALADLRGLPGREARPLADALAEVRALACALHELDALNRFLAERALTCVRGYLDAVSPPVAAYDRYGGRGVRTSVRAADAGGLPSLSTASRLA